MPATLPQLGARVVRKIGLALISQSAVAAAGPPVTSEDVAGRVARQFGVPVDQSTWSATLRVVDDAELGRQLLRYLGYNPIGVGAASIASPQPPATTPPSTSGGATSGTTPAGGTGSADSFATTIVGDGVRSSFVVQHDLHTYDVLVVLRNPLDASAEVPGIDNLAPSPDTVEIVLSAPLAQGALLRVIVSRR